MAWDSSLALTSFFLIVPPITCYLYHCKNVTLHFTVKPVIFREDSITEEYDITNCSGGILHNPVQSYWKVAKNLKRLHPIIGIQLL